MTLGELKQTHAEDSIFQKVFKGIDVKDLITEDNLNSCDLNDRNMLHWACSGKHHKMIEYLLKLKIKVTKDDSGMTPLMISAMVGDLKGCELMLPFCNVNDIDSKGYGDVFDYFAQNGAKMDVQDSLGQTPLFRACVKGNMKIIKGLIGAGVNVNHQDGKKDTALHYCVEAEHGDIAVFLIQNGAKYDIENKDGKTAFQMTTNKKLLEFVAKEID